MISAAAEVQRRLWGTDPQAWADLAESHNRPLFEASSTPPPSVRERPSSTWAAAQD